MAKWEQLIAARVRMHLSQLEAAERVNVGLVTYQRWERGKRRPQPHHMRSLCEIFGPQLVYGEQIAYLEDKPSPNCNADLSPALMMKDLVVVKPDPALLAEEDRELHALLTTNLTAHLWSLAFVDHPNNKEKRKAIRQAIKEFDSMNADNKNYQITRREALWSLATLPMITLGLATPGRVLSSSQYGSAIAHCSTSLEPCWELYRQGDTRETTLAFKCSSRYLSLLKTISQDSALYREEALDLAARYALIKTLLGWICVGTAETIQYAKEAVILSKETGDISLQLSAYSKLAWAYSYARKDKLALSAAQEAEMLFQNYACLPNTQPLHPCVWGGIYSTLALMQAKNGQSPDTALGKAADADPEESHAFMASKRSTLLLEAGWTHSYYGDQAKAIEVLEKRVDPETLLPRMRQSEMGRVETINVMALSLLKTKGRDMEKIIHLWVAGIEGAKSLKNKQRFSEALMNYDLMEAVWPGEPRIRELRGHLEHWEEE
ncbi:MAG TPA: helix-turn-helix transcriptional regulator [Ktedonobacteraceae bacterium]|nr:helix-turn-helix transcriptional regulator [Ktedonobacteraceae bacterium]